MLEGMHGTEEVAEAAAFVVVVHDRKIAGDAVEVVFGAEGVVVQVSLPVWLRRLRPVRSSKPGVVSAPAQP